MDKGEPFDEDIVSDQFIKLCFRRYVKLIPLLKEDDGGGGDDDRDEKKVKNSGDKNEDVFINHQKEMENLLEWSNNVLYPLLEDDTLDESDFDLIASIINDILYVSDNMITIHLVNNMFHFKMAHFAIKLLNTKHGIRFLKSCSRLMVAISHSAKLLFNVSDDLKIFSRLVPCLLSHILNVLTAKEFSAQELETIEDDLNVVKTNFCKILATYQDNIKCRENLKERVGQLKGMTEMFSNCIIGSVIKEISRKGDSIPSFSTPSQLPQIASYLITLFFNKKTWTPLFVYALNSKLSSDDCKDVKTVLACILLLNVYGSGDNKINRKEFKKTLSTAEKKLNSLKNSSNCKKKKFSILLNEEEPMDSNSKNKDKVSNTEEESSEEVNNSEENSSTAEELSQSIKKLNTQQEETTNLER